MTIFLGFFYEVKKYRKCKEKDACIKVDICLWCSHIKATSYFFTWQKCSWKHLRYHLIALTKQFIKKVCFKWVLSISLWLASQLLLPCYLCEVFCQLLDLLLLFNAKQWGCTCQKYYFLPLFLLWQSSVYVKDQSIFSKYFLYSVFIKQLVYMHQVDVQVVLFCCQYTCIVT